MSTKTAVVKSQDGTEHTIKFVDKTTVHGAEATATGSKDAFHGLTQGSDVVVHYTAEGTEKTAVEVDKVGKDGIKSVDGTVTHIDRGGKTLVVKAADGTEDTFRLSDHAATDAGKNIGKGAEKSAKVISSLYRKCREESGPLLRERLRPFCNPIVRKQL